MSNQKSSKYAWIQFFAITFVLLFFFSSILYVKDPSDYLPDKIEERYLELGGASMYGYTFVDWESLAQNENKSEYIDLVVEGLDFAFVHAQWSVVGKIDNETLDQDYLGNLTEYINILGNRGVQVVIHTWVSSYSPSWLYELVPELVGKKDRWQGIDPDTTDSATLEHRQILKDSMVYYHKRLCDYFVSENLINNIRGWCLDDETQSENWTDFFAEITDLLLEYNSSWRIGAMFNRYDKYHITGDAGMTCNYMDPYDHDAKFVQKIHYAYDNSGVDNISVLIDAMGGHEETWFHKKMRREAWIAWFMGVDSIGWYTYLYPSDSWAAIKWNGGQFPIETDKTQAALDAKADIELLNAVYDRIYTEGDENLKQDWTKKMLNAYSKAKANDFISAINILEEILSS